MGASSMVILIIAALVFSSIAVIASRLVTKGTKNPQKGQPYECGIPTTGKTQVQLNVGYYLFALIFLIFDVELIFLFPWAVAFGQISMAAFWSMMLFLGVLTVGFAYEWKKGALEWE